MEQPYGVWGRGNSQFGRRVFTGILAAVVAAVPAAFSGVAPVHAQPVDSGSAGNIGSGSAESPETGLVVPSEPGPPQTDHLAAAWYRKAHPNAVPQGVNDFGCRPTAEHPQPVVLVHGTDSSAYSDWAAIGPQLAAAGFCVFAPNYGGAPGAETYGTEDIWRSTEQVGAFVEQVLEATGAEQADIVSFSQGAGVSRYWMNKLGGAPMVRRWIGLASPSYGGVMYGLVPVGQAVPGVMEVFAKVTSTAAVQQAAGEPFVEELNAGGDTVPGPEYITVGSRVDEMIQPFENIALHGPGARNLVLQDLCPEDLTGHFHMVYDPFVGQLVQQILDPGAPEPVCKPVPLGTGIPEVIIAGNS